MSNEMKMHLPRKAQALSSFKKKKKKSESSFHVINTVEYPHKTLRRNQCSQVSLRLLKILSNFEDLISQSLHIAVPLCTLASAHKYTSPR